MPYKITGNSISSCDFF